MCPHWRERSLGVGGEIVLSPLGRGANDQGSKPGGIKDCSLGRAPRLLRGGQVPCEGSPQGALRTHRQWVSGLVSKRPCSLGTWKCTLTLHMGKGEGNPLSCPEIDRD